MICTIFITRYITSCSMVSSVQQIYSCWTSKQLYTTSQIMKVTIILQAWLNRIALVSQAACYVQLFHAVSLCGQAMRVCVFYACTHNYLCNEVCAFDCLCLVPSAVRDLSVHVNYTNVTATWSTPSNVNGELLYYKVIVYGIMGVRLD